MVAGEEQKKDQRKVSTFPVPRRLSRMPPVEERWAFHMGMCKGKELELFGEINRIGLKGT